MGVYIKGVTKQELKRIFGKARIQYNSTDLIEVKTPHGRLIDTDKSWACVLDQLNMPPELEITEKEKDITFAVISGLILQMPTVIEAEEDE